MEPPNASPRPLAPAPANGRRSQSERRNQPQRENASSACSQCKARKQKCRGGPPCDNCVKSRSHCVIDETTDMRRKTCIKRKIDVLEESQDMLQNLFDALRDSDDEKAVQLFRLIRSNASLADIRNHLDNGHGHGPDQTEPGMSSSSSSSPGLVELRLQDMLTKPQDDSPRPDRRRMLDIRRLVDEPPFRVPARPWTVITKDDTLVSHLVSLWFTWSHPFWNSLDRELFIRDMQAGKLECEFCSPFLVNSILAEACYFTDYQETFTVPGDLTSRGAHFYEEAKRLLEDEAGRISIPTLQGMVTLSVYTNLIGKDRLGIQYLTMASSAAEEFARSQPAYTKKEEAPLSDTEKSISCALWGVFNATEMNGFAIMKFTNATAPKWPRPPTDHDEDDTWSLYPGPRDPVLAHTACVFNSYCEINCIHHEISRSLFSNGNRPKGAELESTVAGFRQRLEQWRDQLPSCINADNLSVPHILSLHMCYHTSLIQIYFFLKSTAAESTESKAAAHAKQQCFTLAKQITSLIRLHRSKWGIERMSPTTIQWVSTSLFALLDGLDNTDNRNAFIELCTVAQAFCRCWTLPKGILRMIQLTASQRGVQLPGEVEALFMDFESQNWDRKDREKFSRSGYPNFAAMHKRDGDHEMDKFLEKWDTLNIDE